jgi:hypothetical protein
MGLRLRREATSDVRRCIGREVDIVERARQNVIANWPTHQIEAMTLCDERINERFELIIDGRAGNIHVCALWRSLHPVTCALFTFRARSVL